MCHSSLSTFPKSGIYGCTLIPPHKLSLVQMSSLLTHLQCPLDTSVFVSQYFVGGGTSCDPAPWPSQNAVLSLWVPVALCLSSLITSNLLIRQQSEWLGPMPLWVCSPTTVLNKGFINPIELCSVAELAWEGRAGDTVLGQGTGWRETAGRKKKWSGKFQPSPWKQEVGGKALASFFTREVVSA